MKHCLTRPEYAATVMWLHSIGNDESFVSSVHPQPYLNSMANYGLAVGRAVLTDETGLGKTVMSF